MQSSVSLKIQIAQKRGGGASSFVKTKVQNDNAVNEMHIAYTGGPRIVRILGHPGIVLLWKSY